MGATEKPRFFSTFIFPFKYNKQSSKGDPNPKDLADHMKQHGWKPKPFVLNDPLHYNEWHYFHPFVREMVFYTDSNSSKMQYLTRSDCTQIDVTYSLKDKDPDPGKTIRMDIKSVDLHLFENQVGLLSFTAAMPADVNYIEDELLIFNNVTRRVYPPFLGKEMNSNLTKAKRMLPKSVSLRVTDRPTPIIEEYDKINPEVENLSEIIKFLLEGMTFRETQKKQGQWLYESFTDDRMFVISYMISSALAQQVSKSTCGRYAYESDDFWYRYVFMDGDFKTIQNEEMQAQFVRDHTYARWANYGTLFGMSRYNIAVLCGIDNEGKFHETLYDQMTSMYYQLALIILFQRSMLLKYSHDVRKLNLGKSDKVYIKEAQKLHGDFIKFTNAYLFSEITPQQQGIELYDQWYKIQDLDKLFSDVKQEIDDVASYVRNEISHKTDDSVRNLTLIMFVLTTWLVLFGDFLFDGKLFRWWKEDHWEWHQYMLFLAGTAIGILILMIIPLLPRIYDSIKSAYKKIWSIFK
ncbi:MAG: hypothetical protein WAV76_08670 [Bacteroidota bacterium]